MDAPSPEGADEIWWQLMATFELRPHDDADSATLAEAAVSQWQAIEAALAPIIGDVGVAALYHRSLYLSRAAHPWLDHERSPGVPQMDLPALKALLAGREAAEVTQASATLIGTFMNLLASLVGVSLAKRLLGPLWAQWPPGTAAEDKPT